MFKVRLTKIGKVNVPSWIKDEVYTVYAASEKGLLIYIDEEHGFDWMNENFFKPVED